MYAHASFFVHVNFWLKKAQTVLLSNFKILHGTYLGSMAAYVGTATHALSLDESI